MMQEVETTTSREGTRLPPNFVQVGPSALLRASMSRAVLEAVLELLDRLESDDHVEFTREYYREGLRRFGDAWGYTDLLTVLYASARLLRPERYLEIGVFRGRSMAVVAGAAPDCHLYGFDLWVEDYAGIGNPGPDYVRNQLRRVGHRGEVTLVSGDSRQTVPAFLADHPDLYFDLITVDGDHTIEGARTDLENVLPRVKVGGVLVFDDIRHPRHPWLERVWDIVVGMNPNFVTAKFTEVGYGVAVAVRRGDEPSMDAVVGDEAGRIHILASMVELLRAERDALREERDRWRARLEASEADRAARLEVIQRQAAYIQELEADRARLEEARTLVRALRASRVFRVLRRLGRWRWLEALLDRGEAACGSKAEGEG